MHTFEGQAKNSVFPKRPCASVTFLALKVTPVTSTFEKICRALAYRANRTRKPDVSYNGKM
jgi:hypothetical protein